MPENLQKLQKASCMKINMYTVYYGTHGIACIFYSSIACHTVVIMLRTFRSLLSSHNVTCSGCSKLWIRERIRQMREHDI